jgi:hypothetical protein
VVGLKEEGLRRVSGFGCPVYYLACCDGGNVVAVPECQVFRQIFLGALEGIHRPERW